MLELKNVSKSYQTGKFTQKALNNFSLKFRKSEFVSILGQSGSGKSTLLNIIAGIDRYDKGDLIINNQSTKNYKEKDWNAYRNNCIGFIFQNYNLINHISVLENVELGMTLSGLKSKEKRKRALNVIKKVGLEEHINKKPNQLSGGQMQRVAIARALANNPDIILADEPTGALDSKTSIQIMNLIKEISKDKLVIMVTHNKELAEKYSTRIVKLKDGKLISDSNQVTEKEIDNNKIRIRKTSMKFQTALKLSFNNIKTKKGRTAITSFASSIGIIGIALILSLSNGFKIKIDEFEKDSLSNAPIIISEQVMDANIVKENESKIIRQKYPKGKLVYSIDNAMEKMIHKNTITKNYINYIEKINKDDIASISYERTTNMILINKDSNNNFNLISTENISNWTMLPTKPDKNTNGIIENTYDVLAGTINENEPGLILQVDSKNQIYKSIIQQLGLNEKTLSFQDILNKEIKIIKNDDYYKNINGNFIPITDYEKLYNDSTETVKVQAIIRGKKGKEVITSNPGILYTKTLANKTIENNKNSNIVKYQQEKNYNVLTNQPFDEKDQDNDKEKILGYLGAETLPKAIYIYPKNFTSKDKILKYLDSYNNDKTNDQKIKYTDTSSVISALSENIMNAITIVLIAFSSISLIVSSIMIGIITYISVLERTKEIGILRSLGARRKDIKRVFNAETFLIGLFSGILGIIITNILLVPTNVIIKKLSELTNVAKLNPIHAIILIVISVILTMIAGLIPASLASKKNPVEALRTE